MRVKTLHSINQTLHNWVWTFSQQRWGGGGAIKVHMHFCTQTHTCIQKQQSSSSPLCRYLPLCRLTSSFRCFRRWPHFTTGKKGSPWQQYNFVGCNMWWHHADIIQQHGSEILADACPRPRQNLKCPRTKKTRKSKRQQWYQPSETIFNTCTIWLIH